MNRQPTLRAAAVLPALAFAVALAVGAPALPAAAQEPALDVFGEVVDVRVVNVEVVVTDRRGNRVTGLGAGDFRLLVDGEEVPVTYFSEVVGGTVRDAGPADGAAPTGVPAAEAGAVGTSYLVFIDDFFSIARDRNQVLDGLAEELSYLGPDDRVAVVAFDGKRVHMLTSWTQSERELSRALGDARQRSTLGLVQLAELRNHTTSRAAFGGVTAGRSMPMSAAEPSDRFFAGQVARKVERSVTGAVAALRGFAQPPGRKVMLLLSGGWPFSPAAFASDQLSVVSAEGVPEGPELFAPLVDTANLLGYTLYPVDVPGLGGVGGATMDVTDGGDGTSTTRERVVEEALTYLARQTGGEALINARRLAPLEHVAADTRSYYWLGFSPERREDDRRHRVEVVVDRPDLRVRSRDSFLDLSRQAERQMAVESALLFGGAAEDGALPVRVGTPKRTGARQMEVPLRIEIPADAVTALPAGEGEWLVRVDLRIAALDDQDRQSDVPTVPLQFRLDSELAPGSAIPYETALRLRRTEQVLVVSLTDPVSGRSLTARVPVSP